MGCCGAHDPPIKLGKGPHMKGRKMNRFWEIGRLVVGFHSFSLMFGAYYSGRSADPHACVQIGPLYLILNLSRAASSKVCACDFGRAVAAARGSLDAWSGDGFGPDDRALYLESLVALRRELPAVVADETVCAALDAVLHGEIQGVPHIEVSA